MPEKLLERPDLPELDIVPEEDLSNLPPAPPPGLDTTLYQSDERSARRDLRRQIAAMEAELAQLFGAAFPRTGIEFQVGAPGGPRILSVDELEQVRDALAARLQDVKGELGDRGYVEQKHRALIEEMTDDPASHKWVRVSNQDIGEPGCRHWHSRPSWGLLGMILGWWRVKVSSGCPLPGGVAPPAIEPQASSGDPASAQETAPENGGRRIAQPAPRRSAGRRRRRESAGSRRRIRIPGDAPVRLAGASRA